MKPVRIGLLGLGRWGRVWRNVLARTAGFELAALCDPLLAAGDDAGSLPLFPRAEDLFACDALDAVLIATPPQTHRELVRAALAAGRHVLCEKPLALSSAVCLELAALAERLERVLLVNCTPVYLDEVRAAGAWIRRLDVRQVTALRTSSRRPAHTVAPLWDLAVHDLAVFWSWFGRLPDSGRVMPLGPDRWRWEGDFPDGPRLQVEVGYGALPGRELRIVRGESVTVLEQQQTDPEPLQSVLRHFANCLGGMARPLTGGTCAAAVARVLEGLETSGPGTA